MAGAMLVSNQIPVVFQTAQVASNVGSLRESGVVSVRPKIICLCASLVTAPNLLAENLHPTAKLRKI